MYERLVRTLSLGAHWQHSSTTDTAEARDEIDRGIIQLSRTTDDSLKYRRAYHIDNTYGTDMQPTVTSYQIL